MWLIESGNGASSGGVMEYEQDLWSHLDHGKKSMDCPLAIHGSTDAIDDVLGSILQKNEKIEKIEEKWIN